ncbi:MAG TPA: hypothetical protein VFP34_07490, partial [Microlunatus sp.]|nr:hypothetical protein [Microlunatus sp.]
PSGPSGATEPPLVVPSRSAETLASVQRAASGSPHTWSAPSGSPTPIGSPTAPAGAADLPTVARSLGDPPANGLSSAAVPLPVTGGAATADGSEPRFAGPRPASGDGLEPPLLVRSVQRRAEESWGAPAGGPTGASETAPLSGFAAAISALRGGNDGAGDPVVSPTTSAAEDLVVARQVSSAPTAAGRPGSIALSSAGPSRAVPQLVVARRLSPDESGHLPTAAARVAPVVSGSSTAYDGSARGAGRAAVERSLIADLPPLVPNVELAAPEASPAGAAAPPTVQRLQYEDLTRGDLPVPHPLDPVVDPLSAPPPSSPVSPTSSVATAVARTRSAAPATPSPTGTWSAGPVPGVQRSAAVGSAASPTPASRAAVQDSLAASLSPVVPDEPALRVQRQADPATGSPGPATGSSTRTVGLAEMFAIAAGTPDEPSLQRSADPAAPVTESSIQLAPDSAAPAAGAAGAGASAPAAPASGADLEEMARRLYEPLSARLRAELWQDRERSGLLTDLRP